ncbi:hypothetical protein HDZ31DRAFT_37841 [Schizophyllum fasciatum]
MSPPRSAARRFSHVEIPPSPFAPASSTRAQAQPESAARVNGGVRRFSHVEIPPSPIAIAKKKPSLSNIDAMDTSDDTAPQAHADDSSKTVLKRKLSATNVEDAAPPKKAKMLDAAAKHVKALKVTENAQPGAGADLLYCHQCRRKRSVTGGRRCVRLLPPQGKKAIEKQCSAFYCEHCLNTRYETDVLDHTPNGPCAGHKHVKSADYVWSCPKCLDICTCSACRNAKGLEPLGTSKQPKSETTPSKAQPAAKQTPATTKSKAKPKPTDTLKGKGKGETKAAGTEKKSTAKVASAPRAKPARKAKCTFKWNAVYGDLDHEEAVIRMHIREFALRFHQEMKPALPKIAVEELETLATQAAFTDAEDALIGWVSDVSVKSLVIGLLSMIAEDSKGGVKQKFQRAIKDLKQSGVGLGKLWSVLEALRESFRGPDSGVGISADADDEDTTFRLPDPLPLPDGTAKRTRQMRNRTGIVVAQTAQLVPVVAALVEAASATRVVHDVLDEGAQEVKERTREMRDALKVENARWDTERKAKNGKGKAEEAEKREAHKRKLQDIEDALKVILPAYNVRFAPLGTDADGRVYYALAPSLAQFELAQAFLAHKASPGMVKAKRRRGRDLNETRAFKKWSTFVAVWGAPPEDAPTDEDDDDGDDDAGERWSGFADPDAIEALAEWVESRGEEHGSAPVKSTPRGSTDSVSGSSGTLVKRLKDAAAALRWQMKGDEGAGKPGKEGLKPIPCAKFYS